MLGRTVAHYRIQKRIGAGGMGVVYQSQDMQLGRSVALKVVRDDAQVDEKARERLLREARTASALNHPNICAIYEAGIAEGETYIAMELVEGQPLSAIIGADGLPVETAIRYAVQIADALARPRARRSAPRLEGCERGSHSRGPRQSTRFWFGEAADRGGGGAHTHPWNDNRSGLFGWYAFVHGA
jgi:serine/threonine protein kinase